MDFPHRVRVLGQSASDTKDADGGTQLAAPAAVADNVPCLISQGSGARQVRFDGQPGTIKYTVTGTDPALGRDDVKILVLSGPRAGKYFRVVGAAAAGPAGGFDAFYRATCEELMS